MTNTLRRFVKGVLSALAKIDRFYRTIKWKYLRPKNKSSDVLNVHFLLVKDTKYVSVIKICLDSFLYWHPAAKITIHVDSITKSQVEKELLTRRKRSNIEIKMDMDFPESSWQNLKLRLLACLNGTFDIYLDTDMRWNGTMPECNSVTFFTTEFTLKDMTLYLVLLTHLQNGKYMAAKMRNTSFFTFWGFKIDEDSLKDIEELHNQIISLVKSDNFGSKDRPHLLRIAEQLAISIASEDWGTQISQLKDIDIWKDGSLLNLPILAPQDLAFK